MSRKWFWVKALTTLILIGLLAAGGYVAYRTGWSQGYAAGQLVAEGEEGATVPPGIGYPGWPFGFVPYRPFGGGLLLMVLLALLFLGLIGKLIRFIIWGSVWRHVMAGPWPEHGAYWHRAPRWHRKHGPVPPWWWGWEESPEEQSEPDTGADAAGA